MLTCCGFKIHESPAGVNDFRSTARYCQQREGKLRAFQSFSLLSDDLWPQLTKLQEVLLRLILKNRQYMALPEIIKKTTAVTLRRA